MHGEYEEQWAVIADKGYQDEENFLRLIHPKKKPSHHSLNAEENIRNRNISSDRITLEEFFGSFCSSWALFSVKYRWAERNYEELFFAMVLTNLHIKWNPFRERDHEH